ncbi:hypothetical protein TrCOL_g11020 [Triparma columacea]|uniref:Impact N-terminal domain-containing protein n=1 Tax=Triparma columacea TaxID=722753 RepID=A0A9W7GDG5_9STRA|nr:hypothetical protein TrCOL_g11020 [Triparma columacea]
MLKAVVYMIFSLCTTRAFLFPIQFHPPQHVTTRLFATLTLVDDIFEAEIVRKKSRFIGVARRVDDFPEAERFIKEVREQHPKARHVVFGYVGCNTERSTDDGEPTGTAGSPVLQAVKGEGLSEVCCCVVRYSGGIKLGAGGLIRAYGGAAREVLRSAETVEISERVSFSVSIPPSNVGDIYSAVSAFGGVVESVGDKYSVTVPLEEATLFVDTLTSRTAGAATIIEQ